MSGSSRRATFAHQSIAQTSNDDRTPTDGPNKRRRTAAPPPRDADNQETGLMRDGGLPRFVGSGSGIYFVRKVYSILGRSGTQLVPGEDDQLQDTTPSGGPSTGETPGTQTRKPFWSDWEVSSGVNSDFGGGGVTFELLVEWTRSYFKIWHPAFPFLHGPEVLDILEKVANQGIQNVSETDAAIIRSMVSISLADNRQMEHPQQPLPVPHDLVFFNLDHVASCASFVLRTPASLKNMQAALCVELFLVSMLKLNMASRLGGSIVRMAYHLGLHRCPRRYPNFGPHDVAMRKRIWWSFYCLERLVCQVLGIPLDVQDDDVDVCTTTTENHLKVAALSESHSGGADASNNQLQLFTLLSKHARIRGMILELRHKSLHVRQDSIERALNVQSELIAWSNEVHDLLANGQSNDGYADGRSAHSPSDYDEDCVSPIYKTLLLVLQHESTITLNRPLLTQKPMTPASQAALQACINSSRAIIEAVDDQQGLRQSLNDEVHSTSMLLAVWPLLTWSVWMSAFILTYAGLEGVTSVASAQRYAKRTLNILKILAKRGTSWPESCAQAVDYLIEALEKKKSLPPDAQLGGGEHSSEAATTGPAAPATSTSTRPRDPPRSERMINNNRFPRSRSDGAILPTPSGHHASTPIMTQGTYEGTQYAGTHTQYSNSPVGIQPPPPPPPPSTGVRSMNGMVSNGNTSEVPMTPTREGGFIPGLDDQLWQLDPMLDPLSALDFSNFAQARSADSTMGLTFY